MKTRVFLLMYIIGLSCYGQNNKKVDSIPIVVNLKNELVIKDLINDMDKDFDEIIKFSVLRIKDSCLDYVLNSITDTIIGDKNHLQKWNLVNIIFINQNGNLYIEIAPFFNINELFNITNYKNIYGCFNKKGVFYFVWLYNEKTINAIRERKFFKKEKNDFILKKDEKYNMMYKPIYEPPIWLYMFNGNEIKKLRSVNIEYLYKR